MVDWNSVVERAFRWYLSCCDEGQEVLYLALCSLYRGKWHHPSDYVRFILRWDGYVAWFTEAERAIMDLDEKPQDFDIHKAAESYGVDLSLRLLNWTCGLTRPDVTRWEEMPPDTLESRLHTIASNVQEFHKGNVPALQSEQQLEKEVEGLKELYSNVLHQAGCRAGRDLTCSLDAVISRLDNVLGDNRPPEDPQRYTRLLLREGQLELLNSLVIDDCEVRPLQLTPLHLHSIYTDLTLLEQNAEGSFMITPHYFAASAILEEVAKNTNSTMGHAVIGGPVGCGKSTLFWQLRNVWALGRGGTYGLGKVQLFFIVNLCTTRATTADELLRYELLPQTTGHFPPGRVLPALENLSVLWVLDGYDRANREARTLAHEVYRTFPWVFLTCQQDFLPVCLPVVISTGIPPLCLIMGHPRGTKDSIIASRVLKRLSANAEADFMEFLVAREPHLEHLMMRPLHVTLLCILFSYNRGVFREIKSVTDLYRLTLQELMNDLSRKVAEANNEDHLEYFIRVTRPWLSIMSEDAWNGLQAGSLLLQKESFQKLESLCGNQTDKLLGSLLDSRQRGTGVEYFWGLGELQDHFAATYLFSRVKQSPSTTIASLLKENNARYNNMLLHLLGLFACHDTDTGFRKYVKSAVEIIHYLKESGYNREKEHCLAGKINRWLGVCLEAKMDNVVMTSLADALPQLRFGDDDINVYFPVVEKFLTQYDGLLVSIHIKSLPATIPSLLQLLRAIVTKHHSLGLALVGSATAYGKKDVSDIYLEEAVNKKQLKIISVEGHYSAAFLRKLPDSVKQLHIRVVTTEELEVLTERVQHLQLCAFNLVLDLLEYRNETVNIPSFKIKWLELSGSNSGLWVFVPLMKDAHLPWLFRVLTCLYPAHYERLYLTACQLSSFGMKQIVTKLSQATHFTLDEFIFDMPDGTCGHFSLLAERTTKKKDAGSLTSS